MRRTIMSFLLSSILGALTAQTFTEIKGAFPFNAFGLEKNSQISAEDLNHPITDKDRITVTSDGHIQANGQKLRIFGTNLSEFPNSHSEADFAAEALAKQGFNCIRFHHTDSDWARCFIKNVNGTRVIDRKRLDDFDYFFAQLKKNGIYSNINLLTGRTYTTADGLKNEIMKVTDWKNRHNLGFWNEDGKKVQKKWAKELLSHVNPYTGTSYLEDPAVAIVEINNENGLLQSYLDGNLEEYTGEYWQDLENQWNSWLKNRNLDYKILDSKYNSRATEGKSLISPNSRWNLESHYGAKTTKKEEGTARFITVDEIGKEGWHVQYNCAGLNMSEDKIYTIKFSIRASKACEIDISLMQAHAPWQNAGFSKKIAVSPAWKEYSFTVSGITTDNNLRLNFGNMGLLKGITYGFKDISIVEGGNLIHIQPGKKSTANEKTVAMPRYSEYASMPGELKNLVAEFLWDTEDSYWKEMIDYVRGTLGSKALLMGTVAGCSTVNIQSKFDIIDTHGYWNHPAFPGTSWDTSNYFVANKDITKAGNENTLLNCAKYRVYGKPFSCSEYDHPYPNQFQAQMYPMLAAYASFQDWDILFTFCYGLPKTPGGQSEKIVDYFDQGRTPVKTSAAPIAARIFRNYQITPGKNKLYVSIPAEKEKLMLNKFHSWNIGDTIHFGMNSLLGLTSQIGVVLDEKTENIPENGKLITKELSDSADKSTLQTFSDTRELYWDRVSGVFMACSKDAMVSVINRDSLVPAFPVEWQQEGMVLPLTDTKDFASVAVSKKDGNFAGFAASWNGNKGESLAQYGGEKGTPAKFRTTRDTINLTTIKGHGSGPAYALGVTGTMQLAGSKKGKFNYTDIKGNPTGKTVTGTKFDFEPSCNSLWFVINF